MKLLNTALSGALLLGLGMSAGAQAGTLTSVQYSTDGSGAYDVTSIEEFDWQSSASTVIEDALVDSSTGATSLGAFFGGALAVGDYLVFNFHYQANLVDMVGSNPSPVPNLDVDGTDNGDAGFEVTVVGSGTERADVIGFLPSGDVVIAFTDISGDFAYYHDVNPDRDNGAGTGFDDGVLILSGEMTSVTGTYTGPLTNKGGSGAAFLDLKITSYDPNYIEADPASSAPLIGSTFDSTLDISFGTATPIADGATIGYAGYTVLAGDLRLSTDAKSQFSVSVPEPSSLFLLGGGFLVMGAYRRRKQA